MLLFFLSVLEITMTTHLIFAVLCLGVASASLIDVLKTVHQNPTFKTLPQRSQILIIELIAETEAGEVKNYIDIVGFEKVISVIDSKYFRVFLCSFSPAGRTLSSYSSRDLGKNHVEYFRFLHLPFVAKFG